MSAKIVPFPRKRAWTAAEPSMLVSGWLAWSRPADVDIRYNLRALRARAREQAQNNDHLRQFLRLVKANVVGPAGVRRQSRVRLRNGKPDKRSITAVEEAWQAWGKRGVCDVTGQFSWIALQQHLVETAARDGEFFVRIIRNWDNGYGIALQVIDPEAVDIEYNVEGPAGAMVRMGVEFDDWRRPVAYHINPEPRQVHGAAYYRSANRTRVPAEDMIHGFLPEWNWQSRGIPWGATPLKRMKILEGYEEAAVTAARAAASKMFAYTQDIDAPGATDLGDGTDGEEKDAQGNLIEEAEPGAGLKLPPGMAIQTLDWTWPNADHGVFEKAILRNMATGLGVSYNTWANDLEGVNYSSLRQGAITERDLWRMLQGWLIETLCERVSDEWTIEALMAGAIRLPNGSPVAGIDAGRERELARCTWQARGWPAVDEQKQMDARERRIKLRLSSISQFIREDGNDPDEVWEELSEDLQRLEALGLAPVMDGAAAPAEPDADDSQPTTTGNE